MIKRKIRKAQPELTKDAILIPGVRNRKPPIKETIAKTNSSTAKPNSIKVNIAVIWIPPKSSAKGCGENMRLKIRGEPQGFARSRFEILGG